MAAHAGRPAAAKNSSALILELTTAFWDAYLKNDPAPKTWFNAEAPKEIAAQGKFESKHPPSGP